MRIATGNGTGPVFGCCRRIVKLPTNLYDIDMPSESLTVTTGPSKRSVRTASGKVLDVPISWTLLPPGDAGLTRRVKARGPHWVVKEKKGRRTFSKGVWADAKTIAEEQQKLKAERSTEAYAKKQVAAAKRRAKKQSEYVDDFRESIIAFLAFDQRYEKLADELAVAICAHATPIGSGTVARTTRIPIEKRAGSAVIAWMRHKTTAYETMVIPRKKGMRREVRRMFAIESRRLLEAYRNGERVDPKNCLLRKGLTA